MPEHSACVIDASVAIKWLLQLDEPHAEQALQVQLDFEAGRLGLGAPDCFMYEIGHALARAVRRGRVTPAAGRSAFDLAREWRVAEVASPAFIEEAWRMTERFGCGFYDGSYLALADAFDLPFVHADGHLRSLLAGRFRHEVWIEDYHSPG